MRAAMLPLFGLMLALPGCSAGGALSSPRGQLSSAQSALGEVLYACGQWRPARPNVDMLLVDLSSVTITGSDTATSPSEAAIERLKHAGALVVHTFNVATVRVRIATDSIPGLSRFIEARAVPDTTQYVVPILIRYSRSIVASDQSMISNLGGEVTRELDISRVLAANVPDSAIPMLRTASGVVSVEPDLGVCAQ